jgi:hypothetical protein
MNAPLQPNSNKSTAIGTLVRLDRKIDRVRRCHENTAVLAPGVGPHAVELLCATCGSHRGWATKSAINFIERCQQLFGRSDALPVIRDGGRT